MPTRTKQSPEPRYDFPCCQSCGSPLVVDNGLCEGCAEQESIGGEYIDTVDVDGARALGIRPFAPVFVQKPPMERPAVVALAIRRETRKDILSALGVKDYDTGAVKINKHQDEQQRANDEAWLKRALDSIGPKYFRTH